MKDLYFVIDRACNRTRHSTVKAGVEHATTILRGRQPISVRAPGETD